MNEHGSLLAKYKNAKKDIKSLWIPWWFSSSSQGNEYTVSMPIISSLSGKPLLRVVSIQIGYPEYCQQ